MIAELGFGHGVTAQASSWDQLTGISSVGAMSEISVLQRWERVKRGVSGRVFDFATQKSPAALEEAADVAWAYHSDSDHTPSPLP